ncbi:short chain dehydrogenase/ reductase [Mycena galericulata]|nr:short chain dehydrogenase/ reductase [Mycena galericulata]
MFQANSRTTERRLMSTLLNGKVVLVTGGAGGLGEAIVKACLEDNKAKVVIADINEDLAKETEHELQKTWQQDPIATTVVDVSVEASAAAAVDFAVQRFGRLDILVNNAGVMDGFHGAGTCEKAEWDRVLGINLTGPYLMTKYAVKHFQGRDDGKPTSGFIVNIGSAASQRGGIAGVAYTSSKYGLIGLTKNTAAVYAKQGIRTNVVLPSGMKTNIGTSMPKDFNQAGLVLCQQVNGLQPELVDIDSLAKTVVHLASDDAQNINGAVINVDNGLNVF